MTKSPERTIGAADQRGIDRAMQSHFAIQSLPQRAGEALSLRVIELHSGSDVHIRDVLDLGAQRLEHRRDFGQEAEPAVVRQHGQKIAAVLVERVAGDVRDQTHQIGRLDPRIRQQLRDAPIPDDGGRVASTCDQRSNEPCSRAYSKAALA